MFKLYRNFIGLKWGTKQKSEIQMWLMKRLYALPFTKRIRHLVCYIRHVYDTQMSVFFRFATEKDIFYWHMYISFE